MKKRLLIYAHYYVPDVASTGQILQDLAEGIKDEFDITVICTVPSYTRMIEEKYRGKKLYREEINGVSVLRVPVPELIKKSKKSRIKNLLAYFFGACKATKEVGQQDYVFTISQPPIIGGVLGVHGKNKLYRKYGVRPKLIYCIQDFNPEQAETIGYIRNKVIIDFMRWIDKQSCCNSDLVITVGRDLVDTLRYRFRKSFTPRYAMIHNWIDEKEIYPLPLGNLGVVRFRKKYGLDNKFIFMYSGNIGLYYDLEGLIKVIEKFKGEKTPDGRDVVFVFVGAGSVLDNLVRYKDEHELNNVVFVPYQDKDKLIFSLNTADVHLCVNAKGIKGVSCPSKFYGIAGVGKPVLAILEKGSEVQMLIDEIGCGKCTEPGDYEAAEKNIAWFISNATSDEITEMGKRGYKYLIKNLTKDASIAKYLEAIKGL